MKKWLPWVLTAVLAAWVISTLRPKAEPEFQTREFGKLPVLLNGRIQPLDSVARNSLLQLRGKQTLDLGDRKKLTATEWLIEVMMKSELADDRKVFRIDNVELLGMLGFPDNEKFFSFNQIQPSYMKVGEQAERIQEIDSARRTVFEKQLMNFYSGLMLYQRLKVNLRPPTSEDMAAELADYRAAMAPGVAAVRARDAGRPFDQAAFDRILDFLGEFNSVSRFAYVLAVPPLNPEVSRQDWKNVGTSLMESVHGSGIHPAVEHYATMVSAYRQNNPAKFNGGVQTYRQWLGTQFGSELGKGQREFFYNHLQAFYKATVLYVLAFILGCAFWFNWSEWMRRSAFYIMALALVIHTFGLIFRMHLEGRPPVTNLYSSAVFIGWGAVILGLVLERFYRDGIGIVSGSIAGFVTQIIAHNLALGGDTMEMLRAVLDTNFWLATHVITITIGYSAMFVAGLLAIIYIVRGVFTTTLNPATASALSRMVYSIICFATLFSFIGTVLGGIWADQSWGRFWGWDPKENGALLIVIWCAIILHARWGGLVKDRGIMAIFGNIVTCFSWFGVNMLGIGLHSYGFMDAAFKWIMLFSASQLAFIGLGLLPLRLWRSFSPRTASGQDQDTPSGTPAPGNLVAP
jgi:ABC-type transport system involved in cytochrome c biogenesis permease subunit